MESKPSFTIYKIYYHAKPDGDFLVYVGRTRQPLRDRLRGHFKSGSRNAMTKPLDISGVSRIMYAEVPTEADMNLYEVYYIVKEHPILNADDRASDDPTVLLPELSFKQWENSLFQKWGGVV
jgi:excinuclease UvrABC nuclease subunit